MRWLVLVGWLGACGTSAAPPPAAPPPAAPPPAVPLPARPPAVALATTCALPAHGAPSTATGAAWQVPLEPGTGGFTLAASGGLVVAGGTGVPLISIDAATGAPCAVLGDRTSPVIDLYTQRARPVHGMLVGGARFAIAAIDLRSGRPRWTHAVADSSSSDEYALRDDLQVVATASAVVVEFRLRHRDGDLFRYEEFVAALDPGTGAERWRVPAVDPRPGDASLAANSILLTSDADRVYVRTPGMLAALDGATGARVWTTTWPATPPVIGPPVPGVLVASDGSRVALAMPGRIRLFDARTGAPRGEIAVPGDATEIVARAGTVYAAVEATPGTAVVVAIDAAAPRMRWTYAASYSVWRLRVDDELVYVLDGNRRVWGLELASARPRFGLNASALDFEVTRSTAGAPRIVVPGVSLTAFDPQGLAPPLESFARWEVAASAGMCQPRALAWIDGEDRVVWQRPLPARIRSLSFGQCNELEMMDYRRSPRTAASNLYAVLGILDTGSALVEADITGVLALDKASGAIVLDAGAPSAANGLFFDEGTFKVTGLADCKGPAHHARVFARCGQRFVYFNGSTALIIAADKRRIEARGTYGGNASGQYVGRAESARGSVTVGPYTLALEGVIYMH